MAKTSIFTAVKKILLYKLGVASVTDENLNTDTAHLFQKELKYPEDNLHDF